MEISELGEFGLIERLTHDIKIKNESTKYGIGDDCAVLHYQDKEILVSSDLLMEGIHFDLTYMPMKHLGYKAAMVNISDIFAMGGTPRQIIVSIAIGKRFTVEDIEAFYAGLRIAADKWGIDVVGGDTTASLTGLAISITIIGEAKAEDIIYRNGAKPTDLICVSGNLGAAYMGLQLLEREKNVFYEQLKQDNKTEATPDFSGKEYLLERQMKPEARGDIISQLRTMDIKPTSMIDISDGLSSELIHICTQSHCGCRLYEKNIPIDYETTVMAEEMNLNVTTCALNGGEDYELLFTVPLTDKEKVEAMEDVKLVGYITDEKFGRLLITRDESELELKAQGWNHGTA